MTSKHYHETRETREAKIQEIGLGTVVDEFYVDKGHPNGPEIHQITSTGIIICRNARTNKICTKLIARPGQILRYYKGNPPESVMEKAREHQEKGYNYL